MTIKEMVYQALTAVLPNSHAVELPKRPTWPAIVFEIDTQPEVGWTIGAGYEQNVVTVVILSPDLDQIEVFKSQIRSAIEVLSGYMTDEEHGDAEYEADPEVYGYFMNFRIRTQQS